VHQRRVARRDRPWCAPFEVGTRTTCALVRSDLSTASDPSAQSERQGGRPDQRRPSAVPLQAGRPAGAWGVQEEVCCAVTCIASQHHVRSEVLRDKHVAPQPNRLQRMPFRSEGHGLPSERPRSAPVLDSLHRQPIGGGGGLQQRHSLETPGASAETQPPPPSAVLAGHPFLLALLAAAPGKVEERRASGNVESESFRPARIRSSASTNRGADRRRFRRPVPTLVPDVKTAQSDRPTLERGTGPSTNRFRRALARPS
jgi:hypothetical protein